MNPHEHKVTITIDMGTVSERGLEQLDRSMGEILGYAGVQVEGWDQ